MRSRLWSMQAGLAVLAVAFVVLTVWSLRFFSRYRPFADLMGTGGFGQIGLAVNDATIQGRAHGRLLWSVSARTMTFSRDRRQVQIQEIHQGLLYDAQGHALAALSAGRATYAAPLGELGQVQGGVLRLDGGIRVLGLRPRGLSLKADSLQWDSARGQVQSLSPVVAVWDDPTLASGRRVRGRVALRTDGLIWDAGQNVVRSTGRVQASFRGMAVAQGDTAVLDLRTGDFSLSNLHGTFHTADAVQ